MKKVPKGIQDKEVRKKEDEYFARVEFERRQKVLEEKHHEMKKKELDELKKQHWMRCPKCGMEMIELEFESVKIDKCSHCLGVYLDDGEVAMLIKNAKPGYLSRLTTLFGQ